MIIFLVSVLIINILILLIINKNVSDIKDIIIDLNLEKLMREDMEVEKHGENEETGN